MILGVDAGSKTTGLSIVDKGEIVYHKTLNVMDAINIIDNLYVIYKFTKAVVEMPNESVLYSKSIAKISDPVKVEAIKRKLMCNVGENRQCAKLIIDKLEKLGIETLARRPKPKTTKWKREYWCKVFNWNKRVPSVHARDASILALLWENYPGWNVSK